MNRACAPNCAVAVTEGTADIDIRR